MKYITREIGRMNLKLQQSWVGWRLGRFSEILRFGGSEGLENARNVKNIRYQSCPEGTILRKGLETVRQGFINSL